MKLYNSGGSSSGSSSLVTSAGTNVLPIFNKKLAGINTGLSNAREVTIGDSVTLGLHSSVVTNQNVYYNFMSTFQRYVNQAGTTAQRDTTFGQGDGTNYLEDSRIFKGSSWSGAANTIGGQLYTATTNTNPVSFSPTAIVNTFIIYYATIPTAGSISVNIDGGAPTVQSTTGANGMAKLTVTAAAPGLHTLNVSWSSGGAVFVAGFEAYNSTVSQLQVMTAGWGGATTANVSDATNAYGPLNALKFVAPDLTIIATGINDWVTGADLTTFKTNYQTLITTAKISGDCVILTPPPSSITQVPQATQDSYINIIKSLATTNNVPVIDIYGYFGTWAAQSGLYFDNLHPNGQGYEIIGEYIFNFFKIFGSGSINPPKMSIPLLIQTVANNTYTYIGYAGSAGTVLGIYEEARAITTAGTFAITINGTNVTGLSAVVPTTAGSYTAATALNTFNRGDKIQVIYSGTTLVVDHTLTLDITQSGTAL